MIFAIDVITADTSHLKDRGLAYAFTSSPYIITAFAGSAASEHFYESNWRWGFGTFAIVLPIVAVPLFLVLFLNKRKAQKAGLIVKVPSGRTFWQSVWYYIVEFDGAHLFRFKLYVSDVLPSPRCLPPRCRSRPLPSPFLHRCLCRRRMASGLHHCYACRRPCPLDPFRPRRTVRGP